MELVKSFHLVNGTQVNLNWTNKSTEELQVILERKLATESEYTEVQRLAPGTTSWKDDSGILTNNLTLFYRLKAKYSQGESDYTNELVVYIP
jgi:hypothetical protein